MFDFSIERRLAAEFVGTAFLLATIVGAGIMADALAGGNGGVALLGDTLPIAAILVVLIYMLGPVSGAHFNPAVTLAFFLRREISARDALLYVPVQVIGGLAGVAAAHYMFGLSVVETGTIARSGANQWFSEIVATFGLVWVVFMFVRFKPGAVAPAVGLYIGAAIWFTASTSFANPAVTIARSFTDTYTGIAPEHVWPFIVAEILGAVLAVAFTGWLLKPAPAADQSLPEAADTDTSA